MKKGFTLIELLVVVLIIGILSAIALPQYEKAVTKSRLAILKPLVASVASAAEEFYLANMDYPSSVDELSVSIPKPDSIYTSNTMETYYYTWGFCYLLHDTDAQYFGCTNTQSNISFATRFQHATSQPGVSSCAAVGENSANSVAYKVCQMDTGNVPFYSDTSNQVFAYD